MAKDLLAYDMNQKLKVASLTACYYYGYSTLSTENSKKYWTAFVPTLGRFWRTKKKEKKDDESNYI